MIEENSQVTLSQRVKTTAIIIDRYLLTKPGSTKETYHLRLSFPHETLEFQAGDSLAIYPENDPQIVAQMLHLLQASFDTPIIIKDTEYLLGEFLTHRANLSKATSTFLKSLSRLHPELEMLCQSSNKDQLKQFLKERSCLDILSMYKPAPNTPILPLCESFLPLLPRLYSIASSPLTSKSELDLTVVISSHHFNGEKRFGVASRYLCHLAPTETKEIPVYIQPAHHFRLPEDPKTPIIMIGPGTGVAPFRAFMEERRQSPSKNWLFFGERHRKTDFYYEDFWNSLVNTSHLILDTAFSRDQAEKLYVQHRMLEKAAQLWAWIQEGAVIYVCGDKDPMAKQVQETLLHIFQKQGSLTPEGAKDYFKALKRQNRYLIDIY